MPKDIVAELEKDHREVEKLFARYEAARGRVASGRGPSSVAKTFDGIRRELSVHAEAEEMVLYPEIRTAMPGEGERLADEGLDEHQEVKEALAALESLDPSEPEFARKMKDLIGAVRHHVEEEEREIFAELPKHLPPERMRELGDAIRRAKSVAPTHPHPSAPNQPPANTVVGVIAGAIDRIRDTLAGAVSESEPERRPGRTRASKRTTSGARGRAKKATAASSGRRRATAGAGKGGAGKTAGAKATARAKAARAKTVTRAKSSGRSKSETRAKSRPRSKARVTARATGGRAGARRAGSTRAKKK